ncbi:hypothetical protein [Novipirellula artificiosorum]|nr:hypothetical protein [Novipirellula artificiosorum]
MKVLFAKRFRRFLLSCLIAGATTTFVGDVHANDEYWHPSPDEFSEVETLDGFDLWCDWEAYNEKRLQERNFQEANQSAVATVEGNVSEVEEGFDELFEDAYEDLYGNYHFADYYNSLDMQAGDDSDCVEVAVVQQDEDEAFEATEIDASSVSSALFAVAETICRRVGVSVQQMTEPFAMVTPYAQSSLEEIARLQQVADVSVAEEVEAEEFVAAEKAEADLEALAVAEEICNDLASLAAEERIDVRVLGQSVLIIQDVTVQDVSSVVQERSGQKMSVGCSPMIATIEDAYLPYDLAAADIQVWNFLPLVSKPYCIVDRNNHVDRLDLWESETPESVSDGDTARQASPEELLDRWVCELRDAAAEHGPSLKRWSARHAGRKIASIVGPSSDAANLAVELVAQSWPSKPLPVLEVTVPSDEPAAAVQIAERIDETEQR